MSLVCSQSRPKITSSQGRLPQITDRSKLHLTQNDFRGVHFLPMDVAPIRPVHTLEGAREHPSITKIISTFCGQDTTQGRELTGTKLETKSKTKRKVFFVSVSVSVSIFVSPACIQKLREKKRREKSLTTTNRTNKTQLHLVQMFTATAALPPKECWIARILALVNHLHIMTSLVLVQCVKK